MQEILLVIHLILAIALVVVVLLQRSEGGALGIGGSGGGLGGMVSNKGAANLLSRTTAILAACFMVTSMTLTLLASNRSDVGSILDTAPTSETGGANQTEENNEPSVPMSQ